MGPKAGWRFFAPFAKNTTPLPIDNRFDFQIMERGMVGGRRLPTIPFLTRFFVEERFSFFIDFFPIMP